jgi:hypothetical protein
MQCNPQPWITTGVVLVGASLIAVTPVTTQRPDVQHRSIRLVDYDEFDASQLVSTAEGCRRICPPCSRTTQRST